MVGLPYDCLANPLGAVRLTFEKMAASSSDAAALDGKDWGVRDLFHRFLTDEGGLSEVPMVTPSTIRRIRPNTLVRLRGMIQDMFGNEYYIGAYKEGDAWRTTKYTDASQCPMYGSTEMRIWERRLLYCVPVPGQNSWAECQDEDMRNPSTTFLSSQREKRRRDDDSIVTDDMVVDHADEDSPHSKKMREDGMAAESLNLQNDVTNCNSPMPSFGPPSEDNSFACLVKIYDSPESELKLNDVIEFVGILSYDGDCFVDSDVNNEFADEVLVDLPGPMVPRLHCVVHRKLATSDFIPNPHLELSACALKELREALLSHLAAVLGNDRVAAQYLLLHLLSRVQARVDSIAVGKLSLNLTCFNKESTSVFGNHLKLAIESLLPFTRCLPLTVDYLNNHALVPKKDYSTNRLASGLLQLAEGSHLIIDETALQAGTLNSGGVENARVLKNMIEAQKVEYDFEYYKMEMDSDVQLLILSEGKSNILPADLVLPFHPSSVDCISRADNEEMLRTWRWYLAAMKSLPHSIDLNMQKVVEDDLVAARQADRNLSTKDLSRWVTMGRLMSVSFGETSLSMDHWQMVKELESLRRERLTSGGFTM